MSLSLVKALLIAFGSFVISFVLTFVAYLKWIEWSSPDGNTAQGDMGWLYLAF